MRWIRTRTRENNAALAAHLWDGQNPHFKSPPKKRLRPVDATVYKVDVSPGRDAIRGNPAAPVTLVVFAEFQCPFCARLWPRLQALGESYGRSLRIVFKHNPLSFHKEARPAAHAALCAMEQDRFWDMGDALYENQKALTPGDLERYAGQIGLDVGIFGQCLASRRHEDHIKADQDLASSVTATGTPNSFVNGRKITGARPIEDFKTLIDEELAKAKTLIQSGVAPGDLYEHIIANGRFLGPLEGVVNEFQSHNATREGSPQAPIQVVLFADFECPGSAKVAEPLRALKAHYGDRAAITFKNFPLGFHKQAMNAAEALLCAGAQGKGWEMHDTMFAHRRELADSKYAGWATGLGMDQGAFTRCMDEDTFKGQVEAEMTEGRKAKVRGTPTVFINGRKVTSPKGYKLAVFTSIIDKHFPGTGKGKGSDPD